MFEFKIDNAHRAYELMQSGWPTRIVSLVGPDLNFDLPKQGDHHLIKVFHDFEGHVEPETLEDTVWELKHPLILPTKSDMREILEFTEDLTDEDRLLIHCHAGRSRSVAALISIIFLHMAEDPNLSNIEQAREAIRLVQAARPTMIPNRLMLKYADSIIFYGMEAPLTQASREYWDSYEGRDKDMRTKYSGWKGD